MPGRRQRCTHLVRDFRPRAARLAHSVLRRLVQRLLHHILLFLALARHVDAPLIQREPALAGVTGCSAALENRAGLARSGAASRLHDPGCAHCAARTRGRRAVRREKIR